MPHTCCVFSCNYGYHSCTYKQKYAMFRFPKDAVIKNKWLSAITHKNWIITENTRVYSKHFEKKYFKESSTDKQVKRHQARETSQLQRLSLKPSAMPHIFPELPSHYSIKTTEPRALVLNVFAVFFPCKSHLLLFPPHSKSQKRIMKKHIC